MIIVFDTDVAAELGHVNDAIILHNLYYWIKHNKANQQHFHEGRYWSYNSISAFGKLFPFLSARAIRSALDRLEDNGYILKGNFNKNSYDRTLWYTITGKALVLFKEREEEDGWRKCDRKIPEELPKKEKNPEFLPPVMGAFGPPPNVNTACQNDNHGMSEMANGVCENDKLIYKKCKINFTKTQNQFCENDKPIPNINTYINTKENTDKTPDGIPAAVVVVDTNYIDNGVSSNEYKLVDNECNNTSDSSYVPPGNFSDDIKKDCSFKAAVRIYRENIRPDPSRLEIDELQRLYNAFGHEWLVEAIRIAKFSGKTVGIRYIQGILYSWQKKYGLESRPWEIEDSFLTSPPSAPEVQPAPARHNSTSNSLTAANKAIAMLQSVQDAHYGHPGMMDGGGGHNAG